MSIDARQYDCRDVGELTFDYVEQNLTNDIRLAIQYHYMTCSDCCARLEEYRSSIRAAQQVLLADPPTLPASLSEELVTVLEAEAASG